jgi:PAS domain S-box-containing protein
MSALIVLVVPALAIAVSLALGAYAWRQRHLPGASAFAVVILAEGVMFVGSFFEIISVTLETKMLWDQFVWIFFALIPVLWARFILSYIEQPTPGRWFWAALLAGPVVFIGLLLTNTQHRLVYPPPILAEGFPSGSLAYEFGPALWFFALYLYLAVPSYGYFLLLRSIAGTRSIRRYQSLAILAGMLLPVALGILGLLLNIRILGMRDTTPYTAVIGNLLIVAGLVRFRFAELVPTARDMLIDNMTDTVIVIDTQERIIDLSRASLQYASFKKRDVIGLKLEDAFPDWREITEYARASAETRHEYAVVLRGEQRYFDVIITAIRRRNGQWRGSLITSRDVTARRLAEEFVRKQEANYRAILNLMPMGVLIHRGLKPLYANQEALRLLRTDQAQLTASPLRQYVHPEAREVARLRTERVLHDDQANSPTEMRLIRADGTEFDAMVSSIPFSFEGEPAVLVFLQDHTLIKAAARQQVDLAIERERRTILEQFIQDASHDLRTPITGLKTTVYLLRKVKEGLHEEANGQTTLLQLADQLETRIESIAYNTDRLHSMVESLFDLARLDGQSALEQQPTSLNTLARQVVRALTSEAEEAGLRLVFDEEPTLPPLALDEEEFARAVRNLVQNAIQYTPVDGEVMVRTAARDHTAVLEVADTGIGIAPEDLPHIFKRFYRADKARRRRKGGGGMGLAIVARIVELHGGQISVESTPGVGSRFRISLPMILTP